MILLLMLSTVSAQLTYNPETGTYTDESITGEQESIWIPVEDEAVEVVAEEVVVNQEEETIWIPIGEEEEIEVLEEEVQEETVVVTQQVEPLIELSPTSDPIIQVTDST